MKKSICVVLIALFSFIGAKQVCNFEYYEATGTCNDSSTMLFLANIVALSEYVYV